jgi:HEPN domain-containing protein
MNRSDFQQLTELRVREAEVLLREGYFDGAFYLLGYAIECALKACIAKQTKEYDFPPDRKAVEAIYKHNSGDLLKASTLEREHEQARRASSAFDANWKIIQGWTEQGRYQQGKSEKEVQEFFSAIVGDEGVLPWLKKFW